MESFHWDKYYETDIASVDEQHHKLVDLINELGNVIAGSTAEALDVEKTLVRLADYAKFHFADEEALMDASNIDQRHRTHHKAVHALFLRDIENILHEPEARNASKLNSLLEYLVNWLAFHILGEDQSMALQIQAVAKGMSPELAYSQFEYGTVDSVKPMLKAVKFLFSQLDDANRKLNLANELLEEKVELRTNELQQANDRLEHIALFDQLTDLPNRRFAMLQLEEIWQAWRSHGEQASALMIDADHFKEVNDEFGHDAGDKVLQMLARCLRQTVRTDDPVCRLGGDEFLVICPKTELYGALKLAQKLMSGVQAMRVEIATGNYWKGSISIGVSSLDGSIQSIEELLKLADESMYLAKEAGKNCVKHVQAAAS